MLRDPERLERLLLDEDKPIQLIVAGKSHPADDGGKALIQQVVQFADRPEVRHRIAFLPDYDMSMARLLYWGCDVWLNNPLRPLEACGTSGMKSALNGGLNLSIRDGWWDEWYDGENGWAIPSAVRRGRRGPPRRPGGGRTLRPAGEIRGTEVLRARRARSAAPVDRDGAPHPADARPESVGLADGSRLHRALLRACRAVAAQDGVSVDGDGQVAFDPARELADYRRRAFEAWPHIDITDVDSTGLPDTPVLGSKLTLTATVQLAGLRPDEVAVQAVVGRVDTGDALLDPMYVEMPYTGTAAGGEHIFATTTLLPVAGFGRLHGAGVAASSDAGVRSRAGSGHAGLTRCATGPALPARLAHQWSTRTAAATHAGSRCSGRWPSGSPAPRPPRGRRRPAAAAPRPGPAAARRGWPRRP